MLRGVGIGHAADAAPRRLLGEVCAPAPPPLRIAGADQHLVPGERPSEAEPRAFLACSTHDPDAHRFLPCYLNRSRAGSRTSARLLASARSHGRPRMIATGMRSSLPITGSAALASSSANARTVACN